MTIHLHTGHQSYRMARSVASTFHRCMAEPTSTVIWHLSLRLSTGYMKPDTDFVLSYHFKRREKFWYLDYVENHSL